MDALQQFTNELDALVERWIRESELTYAPMVGALEMQKAELIQRALSDDESEEEATP